MKKNTKKGFTLVELLVVIAILAILSSVAVVGYTAFINNAKDSAAKTEAKQIETAIEATLMAGDPYKLGEIQAVPESGTVGQPDYVAPQAAVPYYVVKGADNKIYVTTNPSATTLANVTELPANLVLNDDIKDLGKITLGTTQGILVFTSASSGKTADIDLTK